MILHRDPSDTDVAAAFDTLLRACGYTVVVRKVEAPKPKKHWRRLGKLSLP